MQLRSLILLLFAVSAFAQWKKLNVPTTAGLRGLSVVSAGVVWASGTDGTVIRTTDGGDRWSVMVVPGAEKLDFRGIHAFDEKNAVIISSGPAEKGQARIYRTVDGGATWKQVLEEKRAGIFFDAVAFWDRNHGIVLSDPVDGKFVLVTTSDGGETWKQLPPDAMPPALPKEGAFAASNSCLTVQGARNVWFATGGAGVARVFRSHDRGRHWSVAETPMHPGNASSGIFSLAFANQKFGVAGGGDYASPISSALPNVLFTNDGGRSWQIAKPKDQSRFYVSGIALAAGPPETKNKIFVAVGITGLYSTSLNLDESWTRSSQENLNALDNHDGSWAVGAKGTILRLTVTIPMNKPYEFTK